MCGTLRKGRCGSSFHPKKAGAFQEQTKTRSATRSPSESGCRAAWVLVGDGRTGRTGTGIFRSFRDHLKKPGRTSAGGAVCFFKKTEKTSPDLACFHQPLAAIFPNHHAPREGKHETCNECRRASATRRPPPVRLLGRDRNYPAAVSLSAASFEWTTTKPSLSPSFWTVTESPGLMFPFSTSSAMGSSI
jgi:hypothetical protein